MSSCSKIVANYVSDILDEIALEGLDGITTEALWMRLSVREGFCFRMDDNSKKFLWTVIIRMNDVRFYEIPEPRASLKYYDYSIKCDNQNAAIDLDEVYPYCSVKNLPPGIFGSCQHYFTRVDITIKVSEMNLEDIETKFGNKLVIVASQESREFALMGNFCTPNLNFSNHLINYDILERIGRSRDLGLATYGKGSIESVVGDHKSVFHYLKFLHENNLVKKQSFLGKLIITSNATKVYLTRFSKSGSDENISILQTAIEELKARPNYIMPSEEFYALFDSKERKRIMKYKKSSLFKKYITVVNNLPYRTVYPNSSQSEWEKKSKQGEKVIRCFKLINPDNELGEVMDVEEEDSISGFIPRGVYYKNMAIVTQAYHHIKNSGSIGITHYELAIKMGLNKRFIRSIIKRLTVDKSCKFYIESDGRRRSKRFIVGENVQAKAVASEIAQILSEEKQKKPNAKEGERKGEAEEESEAFEKINLTQLKRENISNRGLRRIAMVIKTIKTHKFRLFHQIANYVSKEEMKEGLTYRVDKVTITRILDQLEKDGIIKTFTLSGKSKTGHTVKLYADPSFQLDSKLEETLYHTNFSAITSESLDEGRMKLENAFSLTLGENLMEIKKMMDGVTRKLNKPTVDKVKESEFVYSPKFLRLNIIHELMIHLVYDYTGVMDRSQEEMVEELSKTTDIDEELKKEMPKLYGTQLSTYMFVPPLKTVGKIPGWLLVSDILVRMPLSVVVKVFRVVETTSEIWKYLDHPVRRNILIQDLPLSIRQMFFSRKNSLEGFYNDLRRLCYIGLLQYGTRFGREYYQTILYLNRKASLLDTSTSPPEYYQVPSDMKFEMKSYIFNGKNDAKKYWMDMFNICMATRLGVKTNMIGKEILSEREFCKELLKKTLESKNYEDILRDDDGRIPGDNLGAAGLDSVMFSFLRSNWAGPITKTVEPVKQNKLVKMSLQELKKKKLFIKKSRKKKMVKVEKSNSLDDVPKIMMAPKSGKVRKIKERQLRFKRKKTSYDEVDIEALKLMNTLRVTWSIAEDNLLLICRVAIMFLCPNSRTFVRIPWVEIRKVLQQYLPESRNKTQKAIGRRINYMLKNPTTVRSVNLCLEELKGMPEAEKFACSELLDQIKPSAPRLTELQKELYAKFHELVFFLKNRFVDTTKLSVKRNGDLIPDSLEEFLEKFQQESAPEEPLNAKTIRENVIRAILMSSLSCRADKTSSAVQLFDIYRQYVDDELQNAIKKLHTDRVITTTKKTGNSFFKSQKILPLSFTPYKLSFAFQYMLAMKYNHSIYWESFAQITVLAQRTEDDEFEVDLNDCNLTLFLLASKELTHFRAVLPEQIIALDSEKLSTWNYSKVLTRYCDILRYSNDNSKVVCSSGKIIKTSPDGKTLEVGNGKKKGLSDLEYVPTKRRKMNRGSISKDSEEIKRESIDEESEEGKAEMVEEESSDGREEPVGKKNQPLSEKINMSSRVILYLLREEAKKDSNSELNKYSHDSCVVNSCRVFATVKKDCLKSYMKEMEPKVVSAVTKSIISRFLVPLTLVEEGSVLEKLKTEEQRKAAKTILDLVSSKKELGATVKDLRTNCESPLLSNTLKRLTELKIIIKVGLSETRYVAQKYSTAWLLSSFKMTRLEREKVKPSEVTAVVLPCDDGTTKKPKGMITSEEMKTQEHALPSGFTDVNNKIKVIIRPWIRIDGTLNRKVLDRFLGSVLSFIMLNPGISLKHIMNKFSPMITPVWTKDLVEILVEIGCVTLTTLVIKQKANLFSKSVVEVSYDYTGLEDDEWVVVEAKVDAVTILGLFIGRKTYSKDFLVD